MPLWPNFCAGAYQHRSPVLDSESCINLFPVIVESESNSKKTALLGTPGLRQRLSVGTLSCRGLFYEDGRTFGVVGATLYEFDFTALTANSLGTIKDDGLPVSFASNGRGGEQLAIVGGGELKIFNYQTATLSSAVTLPLTNAPRQIAFLDGYFLLLEDSHIRVWFSALFNGTSWDALDFFARSQTSDEFVALAVVRDRVYVLGSKTSEVYYDSGDADTPFIPYPGAIVLEGCVARWSVIVGEDQLAWLSEDGQGRARFVRVTEGTTQRLSTDAIEFALASYTRLDDCEGLSYWQEGHGFLVWTLPTAGPCGITWAFDLATGQWAQRGSWDPARAYFFRWRARGCCSTPQGIIVGDFETGDLHELDLDVFTENGALIRRVRRTPYMSPENRWLFLDAFELGLQPGVGLASGQGSAPQLMLRLSRDGGQTWGPEVTASMGVQGQYGQRAIWRRLGRTRADRLVIEVSQTDPVRTVFGPGAWLRVQQGTTDL
jgi:Phage stabilisation protein